MKLSTNNCRAALAVALGVAVSPLVMAPLVHAQTAPSTAMPAAPMAQPAMPMQPSQMSGQVVRQYVDTAGNVTSVDLQTPSGVQQVRFSPAMMMGDAKIAALGRGSMADLNGIVSMGLPGYNPDGPTSNMMMSMRPDKMTGMMAAMMPGTPGAMSGLATSVLTMNLSAVTAPPTSFKSIVSLPDGRDTVIRSVGDKSYYIDPDNGMMTEVTDTSMVPAAMNVGGMSRVMQLAPDGMSATPVAAPVAGGTPMAAGPDAGTMAAPMPKKMKHHRRRHHKGMDSTTDSTGTMGTTGATDTGAAGGGTVTGTGTTTPGATTTTPAGTM